MIRPFGDRTGRLVESVTRGSDMSHLTDTFDGRRVARGLHASERGEGFISAAIAVLVMAFLGVAMWGAFNLIFDDAQGRVHDQVREIGE
jgi:hypothetical protein